MLLALVGWPISNPSVQKWVLEPRPFGTTFAVVSAKIPRISKTRFWRKPGAPKKRTKWGGARQDKYIWPFLRSLVLGLFIDFLGPPTRKTHSPRSSGHVRKRRTSVNPRLVSTEGVGGSVIVRILCWKMPHFQHGAPGERCIFERPGALTAARPKPRNTTKIGISLPRTRRAPFLNAWPGALSNALGEKKHPIIEHNSIYIYIYIWRRVIRLSTFWPFWKLLVWPLFLKILFLQQPEAKWKLLVWPPESYEFVHFGGLFLPPKVDKLITFQVAKLIIFIWLYVFQYFRLIFILENQQKFIESQVGTPVAKQITFSNLGVIFHNIRCFNLSFLSGFILFVFLCCCSFFLFLIFIFLDYSILC